MLKGKTVILGVTGSIAAYKIANLANMLIKQHCNVQVIMTRNAVNFINPITFESLTGNKCLIDSFDRNHTFDIQHVSLAKKANLIVVAPASADVIAKMAHGIADDMLTTTLISCNCKKIVAPAMNTNMYKNSIVQNNLRILDENGVTIAGPIKGNLACRDFGEGKMLPEQELLTLIQKEIAFKKDMSGIKVLITAGPTREAIDPIRFISNRSSGKMGYALAAACMLRGADVTLISGKTNLDKPYDVRKIDVVNAGEMFEAVKANLEGQDIIIKAAAVADYSPLEASKKKIKKTGENFALELKTNPDILAYLGKNRKKSLLLCGFSMETENVIENSRKKLREKNLDIIVANDVSNAGIGLESDLNRVTIITKNMEIPFETMPKDLVAHRILDEIMKIKKA